MNKNLRTDDFDFDLPEERIALRPAEPRDAAGLLHVAGPKLGDHGVRDLPSLLSPGDRLIVNETRVIPAQLKATRPARSHGGGGDVTVDITLHKEDFSSNAKPAPPSTCWHAFLRPAKRVNEGDRLIIAEGFEARVISRSGAEAILQFSGTSDEFRARLAQYGKPPLPPYIARKRALTDSDTDDYQTLFARTPGSVAAPTAGLHFTPSLMKQIADVGIDVTAVTLHVGAGTFLPVTADRVGDHRMHSEWGEITPAAASTINETRDAGGKIICVGTTSLRLLETAAKTVSAGAPLPAWSGDTDIFITPGFEFRAADRLLTNFHLPRSTLFMLVCAFAGTDAMRSAYAHAIAHHYRFFSYGDACLLDRA